MKSKIIKEFLNDYFSEIKLSKEMFDSIERMFDEFILNKKSNKLENNVELFFDKMYLDIECELERGD